MEDADLAKKLKLFDQLNVIFKERDYSMSNLGQVFGLPFHKAFFLICSRTDQFTVEELEDFLRQLQKRDY